MNTLFRIEIPDERKQVIVRIGSEMGIHAYRGYALFDDSDYADYPNPKWRQRALHLNVRRGVEEISPEHILKLMNDPGCDHLVWLSRRIVESDPIHMAWVYAHELRHVVQDELYPGLSELTGSLRETLRGVYAIEMPQELDAELAARDMVVKLFGAEQYRAYREREAGRDAKAAAYFRRFDQLGSDWTGDLVGQTNRMILAARRSA